MPEWCDVHPRIFLSSSNSSSQRALREGSIVYGSHFRRAALPSVRGSASADQRSDGCKGENPFQAQPYGLGLGQRLLLDAYCGCEQK